MSVKLIKASLLKKGDVIDHWIYDRTVIGKAIQEIDANGNSLTIEFLDGTRDTVPHFVPVFIRHPRDDAQKNAILDMLDDKRSRKWRGTYGHPDIQEPHIPLGWIPLDWATVVRSLLVEGRVRILESGDETFLVKEKS